MALQRFSFSFRTSDFWVSVKLRGFHAPPDPKSQFVGELSLRQDQIHQKRFHTHVLDEFPLGPDRYATLRFAPVQLVHSELHAHLRSLSSSLSLDPSIYEVLAPYIKSMALKLANPNGSLGFIMVAQLEILSIDYVDDLFDDLSDSMGLLAIGGSNGGSTSSSFSLDFVVEKLGEREFLKGVMATWVLAVYVWRNCRTGKGVSSFGCRAPHLSPILHPLLVQHGEEDVPQLPMSIPCPRSSGRKKA